MRLLGGCTRPCVASVAIASGLLLTACSSTPSHRADPTTTNVTTGDTGGTTSTLGYDPSPAQAPPTTTVPTFFSSAPPATAPTPTTSPDTITLTITGTGPAGQVTIVDNGSESQHTAVTLPYSTTLTDNPEIVGIGGQTSSSDPAATITCTISGGNVTAVTKTSSGAYAVVDCSASSLP